jgi:phenylpyruvate tautomerase PptA (4-oxalocrotonate tautomerase family)
MPVYRCTIAQASVTAEQKAEIAQEITRIHCELTTVPKTAASFVHVIFEEVPPGNGFSGGEPSSKALIVGQIRAGRSGEVKTKLLLAISELWNRVTGKSPDDILVAVQDVPARDMVEGGVILPDPGQEEAWLAEHGLTGGRT